MTRPGLRSDAPLLTLEQVADRLGVKVRTVRRFIASGQLRTVGLTARGCRPIRRVTEAELAAFIANNTRGVA